MDAICIPYYVPILFCDFITITIGLYVLINFLRERKRYNEFVKYCKEQGYDGIY
jgi:hypothetical protein